MKLSDWRKLDKQQQQTLFLAWLADDGLPEPLVEYRFDRYRFDYAWPEVSPLRDEYWMHYPLVGLKIALEVEGGGFGAGKPCPVCGQRARLGHQSPKRWRSDMRKYNLAARAGWRVVRVIPDELCTENTLEMLHELLD